MKLDARVHYERPWHSLLGLAANLLTLLILLNVLDIPDHFEISLPKMGRKFPKHNIPQFTKSLKVSPSSHS